MKNNKATTEILTETVADINATVSERNSADNFETEAAAGQAAVMSASDATRDLNSSEEAVRPTRRTFELCGGAALSVNLYDGGNYVVIPVASCLGLDLPIGMTFVYNRDRGDTYLGGFWSNFNERIQKLTNGNYTYVDAMSGVHTLSPNGTVTENYLIDGGLKKTFDPKTGNLTDMEDFSGHKLTIKRDASKKISTITDDRHTVIFGYNNNKISTITDAYGQVTQFSFSGTDVIITYPSGETLTVSIPNVMTLTGVESSKEGVRANITYDSSRRPTSVTYKNKFTEIGNNATTAGECTMSTTLIQYKSKRTDVVLDDDYGTQHVYKFATDGNLSEYYVVQNSVVSQAVKYEYTLHVKDNVYYAKKSSLRKSSFSDFTFVTEEKLEKTLNSDNTVNKATAEKPISIGTTQTAVTQYSYNRGLPTVETTVVTTKYADGSQAQYTVITYNTFGSGSRLTRRESYVSGKQASEGSTIETYTYNSRGDLTETSRYNSLEPNVKFCTERQYDNYGRVTAEYDERGTNSTSYSYDSKGRIYAVTLPGGRVITYSYDSKGNLIGISRTADGQENKIEKGYTKALLTEAKSGGTTVNYTYDYKREFKSATASSGEGVTMTRTDNVTDDYIEPCDKVLHRETLQYPNGDTESVEYDEWGNVVATKFNGEHMTHAEYNADGTVSKYRIVKNGNGNISIKHDSMGRLTDYGTDETFTYNKDGQLDRRTVSGLFYKYTYSDDHKKELKNISVSDTVVYPAKDKQGRYTGKEVRRNGVLMSAEKITYLQHNDNATNLPSQESYFITSNGERKADGGVQYEYNNRGYISVVKDGNGYTKIKYTYNALGRLIREDNSEMDQTITYEYDDNGNMLSRKLYQYAPVAYTLDNLSYSNYAYQYDTQYPDRLKWLRGSYCYYDSYGKLTTYRGKSVTWTRGRFISYIGNTSFDYDGEGKRIKKGNITFTYDCEGKLRSQSNGFTFLYDHTGVFGFKYEGSSYYYRKNVFGDIIAILDNSGKIVVKYVYDAWGNHKVLDNTGWTIYSSTHIGNLNPFRYRGYYYDTETDLYYLKSRYYDPVACRFISADDLAYVDPDHVNGTNLYAYCNNNPVMNVDPEGNLVVTLILVGTTIIGGIIGGVVKYKEAKVAGKTGSDLFLATVGGFFLGAAVGLAVGGLIVALSGAGAIAIAGPKAIFWGLAADKVFAIGALAFDFTAFVVAPILGIEAIGIELLPEDKKTKIPKPGETPRHPAGNKFDKMKSFLQVYLKLSIS